MRQCAGKARHEDKDAADAERKRLIRRYMVRPDSVSVYRCSQCLGWHVGRSRNVHVTRQRITGKRPNKRMRGRV